ncbi:MAG: redoxin domain-containing protein [Planctomycetes bacterium]|nr:redoxin domain-containing protein [Planctomycetota bacterium]
MKYLTPLFVIALVAFTGYATYLFIPEQVEDCCEYVGLLAPEGVSETPGVEHVDFEGPTADGSIPAKTPGLKLNDQPGEVSLPDIDGKQHTIDFGAKRFTAIVWVSSFCPTSKIYETRLNALADDFSDDVQWYGINSSAMESLDELRAHYHDGDPDRLRLTVLKDDRNVIADRFGARVSAEVFVFDNQGRLQYRGGIDDARNQNHVAVKYLRTVLKQLVAGEEPEWRYQPPKGCCPIDKLGADEDEQPSTP